VASTAFFELAWKEWSHTVFLIHANYKYSDIGSD